MLQVDPFVTFPLFDSGGETTISQYYTSVKITNEEG